MTVPAAGLTDQALKNAVADRLYTRQHRGSRCGGIHAKPKMHRRFAVVLSGLVSPAA